MKLFHVSEEKNISIFNPRLPSRQDLDPTKGLVWAINEKCFPNFLTPRNCPRVTFHANEATTEEDRKNYLSSNAINHVVAIEHKWFEIMKNTTLYIYEFDTSDFYLQDLGAGYYVSEKSQVPIRRFEIQDLFGELFKRNIVVRLLGNLWDLSDKIQQTSFQYSMCRMGFAEQRLTEV
ncbi:hypothetical protein PAECIP111891_00656 [Paenibacillus allorhizoplanae]|uniref:DUF4433 domain-containing protein n=1 Tax=Paenibacillus allorhizoplanae TaxID=2905648 RepID=A0ABN8FZE2_9BACL|nr:DUF6886 family protein [Paenibacillus allorhizoplanae]CAH1195341.1 hypothetical protein PAECIP111891_00656 [Paenibacillus allorhizoplanae]